MWRNVLGHKKYLKLIQRCLLSDWFGEVVVLGERCGLLSHATWPRLPLLPTVNGSKLTRPRTFIMRCGGETFSAPVQNLAAQLMCRGTWTDQIVPGTRWYVMLRYEGRGCGVLCSHDESQITVVWDVMHCGLANGPPTHWYMSAKLQGIIYHNLRHLRQI